MRKGDKITIKKHPECDGIECTLDEYELRGRTFLHAKNKDHGVLLAITSPEGEPWNIITLRAGNDGINSYEATWQRQHIALEQFKEEI